MDFFAQDPPQNDEPPVSPEPEPWRSPPEDELPILVAVSEVLAVGDLVAIVVVGVRVFSTGVEILIERRARRGNRSEREWQLAQQEFHGFVERGNPGRLRYGVALGDGQRLVADDRFLEPVEPDGGHRLTPTGGGGNGSDRVYTAEDRYWLWPLPPAGPLEIVAQWPAQGLPESRVVLDGTALREVAARVGTLWP
jgi:hypothetical protein